MSRSAITVENLSKAYHIGLKEDRADTLVGALHGLVRAPARNFRRLARMNTFRHQDDAEDIFWALKDVSFEVAEGEVVGIIGRNGAGKSTLLKILSRITEPTSGRAVIRGRVSSLLEVGTGFHQELTGRENVYMNGTILGMTRREIDRKFDEIVEFSDVEKFLDTPIKHYSSGMKVRLAFAVAAHLEPEILIIDEVLAVGDIEFQRKCIGKMNSVARSGHTVLFVSHNLGLIQSLCTRTVVLNQGVVAYDGSTLEGIERFTSYWRHSACNTSLSELPRQTGTGQARYTSIRILDGTGNPTSAIQLTSSFTVELTVQGLTQVRRPQYCIIFLTSYGQRLLRLFTGDMDISVPPLINTQRVSCNIQSLALLPGEYQIALKLLDGTGAQVGQLVDEIEYAGQLTVIPAQVNGSGYHQGSQQDLFYMPCEWVFG